MKSLNPSMMEPDSFRWGNLDYSDENMWVLENRTQELKQINVDFNRRALDIGLEILDRQSKLSRQYNHWFWQTRR